MSESQGGGEFRRPLILSEEEQWAVFDRVPLKQNIMCVEPLTANHYFLMYATLIDLHNRTAWD